MSDKTVRYYLVRLKLLQMGELDTAKEFTDLIVPPVIFTDKEGAAGDNLFMDTSGDIESKIHLYEDRYRMYLRNPRRASPDVFSRAHQQEVIDQFYTAASGVVKCENCGAFSPTIRRDGFTKIFRRPLNKRVQKSMDAMKFK